MPFAGPSAGSTFRMWRSLVQTSNCSRRRSRCRPSSCAGCGPDASPPRLPRPAGSARNPVSGSTALTTSIMPFSADVGSAGHEARVAEHGRLHQRVAGTHRHAVAARDAARLADRGATVPEHARVGVFPADRQGLVHLYVLARLDAAPAENALARVVAIERIGVIDRVRLRPEGNLLVLDAQQLGRVVDGAVAVVVVAHRAVELVVAEDAVEGCALRVLGCRGRGRHQHVARHLRSARPHQRAVDLHHARVAGLYGAELRVIADLRNLDATAVEQVDEALARCRLVGSPVHDHPGI